MYGIFYPTNVFFFLKLHISKTYAITSEECSITINQIYIDEVNTEWAGSFIWTGNE